EIVGVAAAATTDQALEAVAAAKEAFDDWAGITPHRRAELLLAAVETVMEDSETEAALLSAENGKGIGESTFDLMGLVQRTELACGLADAVESVETPPGPPTETLMSHKPRGVVTKMVSLNWPVAGLDAS